MPVKSDPLIELCDVGFAIHQKTLVRNVDLRVYEDDLISLIGPNGAGKSTLVKLILGLIKPSFGAITRRADLRISYVPQKFNPPAALPLRVKDLLRQARPSRLNANEKQQIAQSLRLDPLLDKQVAVLSGGELQRVLLAKALLDAPNLLALDEPMQGLDPEAQTRLYALIDGLPDFLRCATIVVSHDLHWVMKDAKRVVCLNKHICCQGAPRDIAHHQEFVALFGSGHPHPHQSPYIHQHDNCLHAP